MKALIYVLAIACSGCATGGFTNTEVLVQKGYVVRSAPDTLRTLPPLPPALANPKTATNSQVATFINDTEAYVASLEALIQTLVSFYEKPVTVAEAGTLQPVTPRDSSPAINGRVIRPQTTAAVANTAAASSAR